MTYQEHMHLFADSLPPLTREEERAYVTIATTHPNTRTRRRAKEILVRSTFRFLGRMAIRYGSAWGVDPEELAAEGRMHVWKAMEKFSSDAGVRFLSFAVWDIRHAFQEVRRRSDLIRNLPEEDRIVSLDTPLHGHDDEGESLTFKDFLPDEGNEHPAIANQDLDHAVHAANSMVSQMSEQDSYLIALYFGLGGREQGLTMKEISQDSGMPVQTVQSRIKRVMRTAKKAAGRLA